MKEGSKDKKRKQQQPELAHITRRLTLRDKTWDYISDFTTADDTAAGPFIPPVSPGAFTGEAQRGTKKRTPVLGCLLQEGVWECVSRNVCSAPVSESLPGPYFTASAPHLFPDPSQKWHPLSASSLLVQGCLAAPMLSPLLVPLLVPLPTLLLAQGAHVQRTCRRTRPRLSKIQAFLRLRPSADTES